MEKGCLISCKGDTQWFRGRLVSIYGGIARVNLYSLYGEGYIIEDYNNIPQVFHFPLSNVREMNNMEKVGFNLII